MTAKRECSVCQIFLLGLCLLGSTLVEAASVITNINVSVTVQAPTCKINNGLPIEMNFGDVLTTRIYSNVGSYDRLLDYTLDCGKAVSNDLKIQIQGVASGKGTLSSSKKGLVIKFTEDLLSWPINTWKDFTWPKKPRISVALMREGEEELAGGDFSAAATMMIDYR